MPAPRAIVVQLWSGAQVVQRLAPGDPNPTAVELAQIATAWTPSAGGVTPSVRVLETMPSFQSTGIGGAAGAAGSISR